MEKQFIRTLKLLACFSIIICTLTSCNICKKDLVDDFLYSSDFYNKLKEIATSRSKTQHPKDSLALDRFLSYRPVLIIKELKDSLNKSYIYGEFVCVSNLSSKIDEIHYIMHEIGNDNFIVLEDKGKNKDIMKSDIISYFDSILKLPNISEYAKDDANWCKSTYSEIKKENLAELSYRERWNYFEGAYDMLPSAHIYYINEKITSTSAFWQ